MNLSLAKIVVGFSLLLYVAATTCQAQSPAEDLARLLRDKQVITAGEYQQVIDARPGGVNRLVIILRDKGLITEVEAASFGPRPPAAPTAVAVTTPATPPPPAPQVAGPAPEPADAGTGPTRGFHFYGTLLTNASFNDHATNLVDIPLFASPRTAEPQNNFEMTARQTRLGVDYMGPTIDGARITGKVEVDFLGGSVGFTNGINMDLLRLRLAYGRLDWQHFSVEAGQDWVIFAPLNPTSLAEFAIPSLSASGNLWIRTPQIRTEWRSSSGENAGFLWQLAALDPNIGDNPAEYSAARVPEDGELGRFPAVETRFAFSTPIGDRTATIGISGHWNAAKNPGTVNGFEVVEKFDSWGAALDYSLPFSKYFNVTGELYDGRALGIFSGGISQTVLPVGEPGDKGILSRGGWAQLQINFTKKLQSNTAYGIDAPQTHDLVTGDRSKNQTYMTNLMWHAFPNVTFAIEWRRMLTDYRYEAFINGIGDHFNLAAAYTF